MPQESSSIIVNQFHTIGESLIRVNNLASHIGTEIRAIQHDLIKAMSVCLAFR